MIVLANNMAAYDKLISLFSWTTPENGANHPIEIKELETDSAARTTIELGYDIVGYFTDSKRSGPVNGHAKTLRRTVDELSERHGILFNGIMRRLTVERQSWDDTFTNIADEMFADGQYNWGRVVTLYAFAGWFARHCKENRMEDLVPQIATRAGLYASEKVLGWIKSQGGWDVFEQFFAEKIEPENVLWNGLLYTFVGLGALATMAAVS